MDKLVKHTMQTTIAFNMQRSKNEFIVLSVKGHVTNFVDTATFVPQIVTIDF
jgi:hypothetical protein